MSRLQSHRPIWSIDTGSSTKELWRETWEVNPTVNSFIIDDLTYLVPGYDLPRREWCLLNRFRSGTGRCAASLHQWGYTDSPLCICGDTQSMSHIVNDCPVNKFDGGLLELHTASDAAKEWLCRRGYSKENFELHMWAHGERGARAYNGGLGAEPPAGV